MLQHLKLGDKIGIYSPSSPITYSSPNRFNRAKQFLSEKGFEMVEGKLTGKHDYYRSGSIKARVEELNELLRNPEVKCIMSTIGGTNSNSMLPYLDYAAFKQNPKIVIGYSDATAILFALYAKTGIPTFYGPALVPSFGEYPPFRELTYQYFEDVILGKKSYPFELSFPPFWTDEPINWETKSDNDKEQRSNKWITINPGVAKGRLIAGNLNTMLGFWGSPYMPSIQEGDILMIEDTLKDASIIEKSFSLLKVNGVFDQISGLILGKHELFDDRGTGRKPYEILLEVLGQPTFPILADFDCCHTHPMLTLPIGIDVELNATDKKLTILHSAFQA